MHILLIHQAFASPNDPGGTRHFELARYLAENGHRITILASQTVYATGANLSDRPQLLIRENPLEGISVLRCYTYSALHRSFLHRFIAYISFMLTSFIVGLKVKNVDLVWGTSPPMFQALSALCLARLKKVPFLFEVRDLWPDFAIDLGVLRQPVLIKLSRWLERTLYRSADRLIVNSPGFLPHMRSCHIPEGKLAVVANGVETGHFDPTDTGEEFRSEWGLHDRFIVLYAGALGLANDLEITLEAALLLREESSIIFVMVGDGKEKINLMQKAKGMGLSNVLFVPAQPKERIPGVLAAADVGLATLKNIPMFTTTYPNKVFDYMAAGRPTILGIDGVIRQVIEKADGGVFVEPGDSQALAAAVLRMYRDPILCKRQGESARVYVETHFRREIQAQELKLQVESMSHLHRKKSSYRGKRALDLFVTIPTLMLLSPFLLFLALIVRLALGTPVRFKQERPGLFGEPFIMQKFRTMTDKKDSLGNLLPDEERLTPFGRFLRLTSLDELPEFVNVLKGEMSLVGPRPLLMQYLSRYTPEQARRHEAKPGITGWAQVNGRNALSWEDKFALDVWYIDHQSLWLDLKIIFLTFIKILKREGISQTGHATAPEFLGYRTNNALQTREDVLAEPVSRK